MTSRIARTLAALAALTLPLAALADAWPSKPLKIVVPFSAGGSTDTVARILSEKLGAALGQSVIVDNRPGAGGAIGSEYVARSAPDGYTMLLGTSSTMAIAPWVYRHLPFNPTRDFAPVSLLGTADIIVVVNPKVPVHNIDELVKYAKAHPGKLTFASGGNGSISHLLGEYFKSSAHVDMLHVPYKGDAGMVTDLLAGQVDLAFGTAVAWLPYVKNGKVIALAVTNPKRSTTMTELPTVAESGVPGYEAVQWFGVAVSAGTPKEVVDRLAGEIRKIVQMPDVQSRFRALGFDVVGDTPPEFAAFLRTENAKWKQIAETSHTVLD
ncbi:MAG TPA: tripartite tricarboxylate transporter substrate binding protein [Usitatibacter sp.]|jgi:tripartite-type tricarboxylate transporter receptor subunit TctC|nr:tripartite tricarboxylate transporter substrate binding protein [Usitatibacter sp.]